MSFITLWRNVLSHDVITIRSEISWIFQVSKLSAGPVQFPFWLRHFIYVQAKQVAVTKESQLINIIWTTVIWKDTFLNICIVHDCKRLLVAWLALRNIYFFAVIVIQLRYKEFLSNTLRLLKNTDISQIVHKVERYKSRSRTQSSELLGFAYPTRTWTERSDYRLVPSFRKVEVEVRVKTTVFVKSSISLNRPFRV